MNISMDFDVTDFDGFAPVEQAQEMVEITATTSNPPVVPARRGRKPGSKNKNSDTAVDIQAKIERNRQSARECRARKKLRYQYLEELVEDREKAVLALKQQLNKYRKWCVEIDAGKIPEGMPEFLEEMNALEQESAALFSNI